MRYFLPIPTASAYRRYYCLSCLLSLWLKNVDCSLTERWSRVYSPFNRLFVAKNTENTDKKTRITTTLYY